MTLRGESAIYVDGPWSHRAISANGTRFHIAEAGDGPLVLLLHGFPQFWWTWRSQLVTLADAGYRAVAADLRGYGGSDKPPRGYDLITAASDAAGLIRSLGEANAVVIGHDWGGLVAWTMAAYHPKVVRRLGVISMAHPLRMRSVLLTDPLGQGRRSGFEFGFQVPVLPEHSLVRDHAQRVGQMLRAWSGPGWPDPDTERRYRTAMCIPSVAHSALEYHRWFMRSRLRPDGLRYARRMRAPIQAPTLHLQGSLDTCVLPATARGAGLARGRPVPLAAARRVRALPARGAAAAVRHRVARLAGRPRTRAMTVLARGDDPPEPPDRRFAPSGGTPRGAGQAPRDRDSSGRPRNTRPRDELGLPLPRGAAGVERVPDDLSLPPAEALALAQRMLDSGRAFQAHEVLEASWKQAPAGERSCGAAWPSSRWA